MGGFKGERGVRGEWGIVVMRRRPVAMRLRARVQTGQMQGRRTTPHLPLLRGPLRALASHLLAMSSQGDRGKWESVFGEAGVAGVRGVGVGVSHGRLRDLGGQGGVGLWEDRQGLEASGRG